jgi:hypothetical protein
MQWKWITWGHFFFPSCIRTWSCRLAYPGTQKRWGIEFWFNFNLFFSCMRTSCVAWLNSAIQEPNQSCHKTFQQLFPFITTLSLSLSHARAHSLCPTSTSSTSISDVQVLSIREKWIGPMSCDFLSNQF